MEAQATFSQEEEAFISSAQRVIQTALVAADAENAFNEAVQALPEFATAEAAHAEYLQASEESFAVSEAMPGEGREAMARIAELSIVAAERLGYDEESDVIKSLRTAYERTTQFFDEVDNAVAQAVTDGSNPVI